MTQQINAPKSLRGFAAMSPERLRALASIGGKRAHALGKGHQFTTETARAAGQKGGVSVSKNREHMSVIGKRGGHACAAIPGRMSELGRLGGLAVKTRAVGKL